MGWNELRRLGDDFVQYHTTMFSVPDTLVHIDKLLLVVSSSIIEI
jgi:hypothetical protein